MSDRSSSDINPELWAGIVTIMPIIALYLRSVLAELGKTTAQAVWRFIAGKRQGHPTIVVIMLRESDQSSAVASQTTKEKRDTLLKHP